MAKVVESDGFVTLRLSRWEKLGSLHGDISVEASKVISRTEVENPWKRRYLRGFRAPGTAFPYVILLGTMRFKRGKDFCAIYKRTPAVIYELTDAPFKRWIVSI